MSLGMAVAKSCALQAEEDSLSSAHGHSIASGRSQGVGPKP